MYVPDRWEILKFSHNDKVSYRVLASWIGRYLDPDYWRISSGITKATELDDRFEFDNASGSLYVCYKNSRGMSSLSRSIFNRIVEDSSKIDGYICEVVDAYTPDEGVQHQAVVR